MNNIMQKIKETSYQRIASLAQKIDKFIKTNPCKTSIALSVGVTPILGGYFLNKCYKSLQSQPSKTAPEQIKPDTSAAGRFLREQIRAQQSTVPEFQKVICVGSTIINGQELTTPVDLREPETDDPLGECVNSNGFKSKKLGYVSLADLEEARRIHRSEVEETKQKLIKSWQREYELNISSQPAPTCKEE